MNESDPVLTTSIYHPKAGSEKNFIQFWTERIGNLAYEMGADTVGIYHNEDTDEYLASVHWPSEKFAKNFLKSGEFREATHELNTFCLIPSIKEHFEILRERAA